MRTPVLFKIVILLLLLSSLNSCEKYSISGVVTEDPKLQADLYANALDTLSLGTHTYYLEARLYRDFFPGGPLPRKSPLTASVYLVNTKSLPVPDYLKVKEIFVIHDQLIWISNPVQGQDQGADYKLLCVSNKGPGWGPGIPVDVVAKIVDNSDRKNYFLIARKQDIIKVE
jgi:hypothetical protein